MKKILFTGGSGFLGRNLVPVLSDKYHLSAPSRRELDLKDSETLTKFIKESQFDVIIHAAIPNIAFNEKDKEDTLFKDSLSMFMTLYQLQDEYGKLIYFGSGAEFNKNRPIIAASEFEFGTSIPKSDYGLAKYIMNTLCKTSKNIYNLRLFGCYGPTDADFKFITYAIQCCLRKQPVQIKQNCVFDYMYVYDLIPVLEYFINNTPEYHDYNICTGNRVELTHICQLVQKELRCFAPMQIKKTGLNYEYSGQNTRICSEIPDLRFTSLEKGLKMQINYEKEVIANE